MPRNVYFSQAVKSEQNLYEDLIIESLKIFGQDAYYLPRTLVNRDEIFGESASSKFDDAYMIETYIENTDGFEGDGDLYSKFVPPPAGAGEGGGTMASPAAGTTAALGTMTS